MLVSCFITFLPTETDHIPHFILRPKSIRVVFLSFLLQHFFLSTVNFFSLRSRVELRDAVVYVMRGWFASRFSLWSLLRRSHLRLLRIPWERKIVCDLTFLTWLWRASAKTLGTLVLSKEQNKDHSYRDCWSSSGRQQQWIYDFVCQEAFTS